MKRAALAVALVACATPGESTPDAPGGDGADGSVDGAPRPDAPPGCERPALDAPWLRGMLLDDVGQLAAAPRATSAQRQAARTFLSQRLTALGWPAQTQMYNTGINVYATIPATMGGTGKEVIVGAHFDTVTGSPGANDNASGTAVVLAVARYLADTPCRNSPVTVVLFDQEETGLFGARAFAQTRQPANVRAVHTIDQVAWDQDGDRRFELESPPAALESEWRAAAQAVGVPVTKTTTQGTDHEAFRDRGFSAIGLTEEYVGGDTSPHRHTAQDTAATVNADYLVLAAKLTAQVVLDEVAP
ncbi:MAG: Zn-dependent exopeptidase M28 [Myxococcales bacterium]|nr:Zn-dependent exopeptidase M28 [Myxococcales bacterium]